MKVLFCTDGSDASFFAIKKTLPFLKEDYQIDILNVVDWGLLPTYVTFPNEEELLSPSQKSVAETILDKTREYIESLGYKVTESEYSYGQPDNIIIEFINNDSYDMVILGSHGKKGIRKWLGSVSRKVVSKSHIPVLIARPPLKQEPETNEQTSKNLLIAVDGSECSYNAIQKAIEVLSIDNTSIDIITVRPGAESLPLEITMDNEWLENCLDKQKEIADEVITKALSILKETNISAKKVHSIEGDPAEEIIHFLEKNPRDLTILGSHGREGLSDFLLGSVSKRILDHAESTILIIPNKK